MVNKEQAIVKAIKDYTSGDKNVDEIAEENGVHPQTIYYWFRKAGIQMSGKRKKRVNWSDIKSQINP